jgi:hypothetical protein
VSPVREPNIGIPPSGYVGLSQRHVDRQQSAARESAAPLRQEATLVAELQAGLLNVVSPEDFKAHWDLAVAYEEMGLVPDAIIEFATSLDERAPQNMAQDALDTLFGPPRARPGALDRVVLALG